MIAQLLLVGLILLFATASLINWVRVNPKLLYGILAIAIAGPTAIYSTSANAVNYNPVRAINSVFTPVDLNAVARDYQDRHKDPHRLKVEHRNDRVPVAIVKAAKATGVDPNMLATFANVESTMNAKAKNGRVKGLLQFTPGTWKLMTKRHAKKHGLRHPDIYNPYHNALLGAELINDNSAWLEARLKREVRVDEKYLANFISPYYALKMIRAGGWRSAKDIVPTSFAKGNPTFFYKKGRPLSVREFRQIVRNKLSTKSMEITQPTQMASLPDRTCVQPTVAEPHASPTNHILTVCASDLWGDRRRSYGV